MPVSVCVMTPPPLPPPPYTHTIHRLTRTGAVRAPPYPEGEISTSFFKPFPPRRRRHVQCQRKRRRSAYKSRQKPYSVSMEHAVRIPLSMCVCVFVCLYCTWVSAGISARAELGGNLSRPPDISRLVRAISPEKVMYLDNSWNRNSKILSHS